MKHSMNIMKAMCAVALIATLFACGQSKPTLNTDGEDAIAALRTQYDVSVMTNAQGGVLAVYKKTVDLKNTEVLKGVITMGFFFASEKTQNIYIALTVAINTTDNEYALFSVLHNDYLDYQLNRIDWKQLSDKITADIQLKK